MLEFVHFEGRGYYAMSSTTIRVNPVARRGLLRAFALLELAALIVGLSVLSVRVIPHAWRSLDTDFPNDYVAARLVRESYTVDRIYEWEWFEEQRVRMGVDYPTAGFIPHTPFSVLPMIPFTWFEPLAAKRAWITTSLLLLLGSITLISNISHLRWQWVATAAFLSMPLYRNLEYGQFYVLVLSVLSLALWCYGRDYRFTAGLLTAIAAGLKIFPVLLIVFYLRKRDFRALVGFAIGAVTVFGTSLYVFGWVACIRYVNEILPAAMRGEAMDPFALAANSISSVLHHIFILDPQLNSHPIVNEASLVGLIGPLLQILIWAPIALLCSRTRDPRVDNLEWSGILIASLTISTLPASYNFIVLLLPCAIWVGGCIREGCRWAAVAVAALYFLIGWLPLTSGGSRGFVAILAVPRLWCLLLLSGLVIYHLSRRASFDFRREGLWIASLLVLTLISSFGLARHESRLYSEHASPLIPEGTIYVVTSPQLAEGKLRFHGMARDGWHWYQVDQKGEDMHIIEAPTKDTAWLVENKGRHSLWINDRSQTPVQVSSDDLDVYEFSAADNGQLVFSALTGHHRMELFVLSNGKPEPLHIENARFPAFSPDGRWLAYAKFSNSSWHLTLRKLDNGNERHLGTASCNQAYPAWVRDSQTLIYASDCGRGLWQTTLESRSIEF